MGRFHRLLAAPNLQPSLVELTETGGQKEVGQAGRAWRDRSRGERENKDGTRPGPTMPIHTEGCAARNALFAFEVESAIIRIVEERRGGWRWKRTSSRFLLANWRV